MTNITALKNKNIIGIELNSIMMLSRLADSTDNEDEKRRALSVAQKTAKTLGELLNCKVYCTISNHVLFIKKSLECVTYGTIEETDGGNILFFHELWGDKGGDVNSLITSVN